MEKVVKAEFKWLALGGGMTSPGGTAAKAVVASQWIEVGGPRLTRGSTP